MKLKLTKTFLRIVAVKKHQPNSVLKAWFMENVVNSKRYLQKSYSFKDLGLQEWANKNKINPLSVAIDLNEISKIASYLPMSNNGEQHKALRKRFAIHISKKSADTLIFFKK